MSQGKKYPIPDVPLGQNTHGGIQMRGGLVRPFYDPAANPTNRGADTPHREENYTGPQRDTQPTTTTNPPSSSSSSSSNSSSNQPNPPSNSSSSSTQTSPNPQNDTKHVGGIHHTT